MNALNHDGLGIDKRGRGITTDIESPIKSRMANIYRHTEIGGYC